MELTNWQQLSDLGPGLVLCVDFPGGLPTAVVQRAHECGTDRRLACALRELIG